MAMLEVGLGVRVEVVEGVAEQDDEGGGGGGIYLGPQVTYKQPRR